MKHNKFYTRFIYGRTLGVELLPGFCEGVSGVEMVNYTII